MQKLTDQKIQMVHRTGRNVSGSVVSKKGSTLFSLFNSPRTDPRVKSAAPVLTAPVPKSPDVHVSRANLSAVKSWVAMEEKIVDGYKEQKTVQPKSAVPLPKIPVRQLRPAFETFTLQTAVSLSPDVSKPKSFPRSSERGFPGLAVFLVVCGGLAAGGFVFLQSQATDASLKAAQEMSRLQSEKGKLERSYVALKDISGEQRSEIEGLNDRLHGMTLELKAVKDGKVAFERGLEKKYREELMKISIHYQSELNLLRETLQTQGAIVKALKAQGQAFDQIVGQVGISALSGAAAGLSQGPFSGSSLSAPQGVVSSVNSRQRSLVINLGSENGALSGRWITISRRGTGVAVGRIDRVYPTMSVAMVRDTNTLSLIQTGDNVSFS